MGWAALVAALQAQLKQSNTFTWSGECGKAFAGVKQALCSAPVLALPDLNKPFEVICDACGVGLGAVLLQDGRPIAFEGKRMSPAEQNYSVGEQELLAVILALELWRCYLDGVKFTVVTDHSPNTFFATQTLMSPRQARWAEKLSRFSFMWEYRPGRVNVADPLSRHPTFTANSIFLAVTADSAQHALLTAAAAMANTFSLSAVTDADRGAATDADRGAATDADIAAENAAAASADQEMLSQILQGYSQDPWFSSVRNTAALDLYQGLYYKDDALVVPHMPDLKRTILQELHDANYSGHVGYQRTIHNVQRMYWWPGMYSEICEYVKGCLICSKISTCCASLLASLCLCPPLRMHGNISLWIV